jgi:hypothetical protein
MFMPGHQARLSPLPPIQSPSPPQSRRPTMILLQSRRAQAQILTAHAHAQENEMTSVDGHEHAASHATLLVAVTAVAV